jgi:hypothetical protein
MKVPAPVPNENEWLLGGYDSKRSKDRAQGVQVCRHILHFF